MNRRRIKVEHEEVLIVIRLLTLMGRYESLLKSAIKQQHPIADSLRQDLIFTRRSYMLFSSNLLNKYPDLNLSGNCRFDADNDVIECEVL